MTDDHEHEVLERGIAVLADGDDSDDDVTAVTGVAIGEGDITKGRSGKRTVWPAETLRDATAKLVGKPIVRNHPDPTSPQPPIESIIGEVTETRYEDGVGLLWRGEIDDPDVADQIDRGRVDVSPVMARELGEFDDETEAHVATEIHAFRDLGVVARGASPSNAIQPDAEPAAALDAEALAAAFDGDADAAGEADGQAGGEADDPSQDDDPRTGASTGRSPTDEEVFMTEDDLTDKERELLAQARQCDDPVVMPSESADRLDDAAELLTAAQGIDSPTVVDEEKQAAREERLGVLEDQMTDALVDQHDYRPSDVVQMSFEEKAAEFEDEDGDFDAEALVQTPETGATGTETGPSSGSNDDELTEEDEQRLEQLEEEIEIWSGRDSMDNYVESLREEREALTGGN